MEIGLLAVLGLGTISVVAVAVRLRRRRLARIAEPLGLSVTGDFALAGLHRGAAVRLYDAADNTVSRIVAWAKIPDVLPSGLSVAPRGLLSGFASAMGLVPVQLGTDLDRSLRIGGAPTEAVRELLLDDGVSRCLAGLVAASTRFEVVHGGITLDFPGRLEGDAAAALAALMEVVEVFVGAGRGHWIELAHRHGLARDDRVQRLAGIIDGVDVTATLHVDRWYPRTVISGTVQPPLPPDTQVVHRDLDPDAPPIGDPVLDGLVAIRGDLDRLRPWLCTDAVRGPLLEVVHGFPRSTVRTGAVVLTFPGRLGRSLAPAIDRVVDLARALDAQRAASG